MSTALGVEQLSMSLQVQHMPGQVLIALNTIVVLHSLYPYSTLYLIILVNDDLYTSYRQASPFTKNATSSDGLSLTSIAAVSPAPSI